LHAWSRDGRAIVYARERDGVGNLWSQPLAGGEPRQLSRFEADNIDAFAFSPDGKQVALSRGESSSDVVLITDFR
jgi:Tol biopolymer transport system component